MLETIVIIIFVLALLFCAVLGISLIYALLVAYILFAGFALVRRYKAAEVIAMSWSGIKKVKNILLVFMLLGMLTAVWRAAVY